MGVHAGDAHLPPRNTRHISQPLDRRQSPGRAAQHSADNDRRGDEGRTILTCCTAMLVMMMWQPSTCMAAPPTDACALVTSAQVGAALGGSVGPGKALTKDVCQ